MALFFLVLSTLLQLAASVQAMRLVCRRPKVGWVFLAAAMVLMLARRAFTLYSALAADQMLDLVAELLALLISILLASSLTFLLRWRSGVTEPDVEAPDFELLLMERLKQRSVLLGLMALLGISLLSYVAYTTSRDAITERLAKGSLDLAHMIETSSALTGTNDMLRVMKQLWTTSHSQYPENYLCVIGPDGRLLLNTRRPEMAGRDVGETKLPSKSVDTPKTVRELALARQDWAGRNHSAEGLEQIAGYAYSSNLNSLLAVHLPAREVDAQVYAELLPWLLGLVLVVIIVLPLSLGMLYRVSSASQHTAVAALQKQHRSDERFRRIVETASEGVWTTDEKGRTTFVNARMAGMLGCSVPEMLGQPMGKFMEKEARAVATENGEPRRQDIAQQHESKLLRKDGSSLWALLSTSPLQDEKGEGIGALAMVSDFTERKRLEKELTETSKRLRTIIETEPECVKIVGPAGDLIEMNPAGLAMLEVSSLAQAQLQPLSEFIVPEHRDAFRQLHHSVFRGETGALEFEVIGLKGTRRWLETHAVPLRDDEGRVTSLLSITRDIITRRAAEQSIRQINAELEKRVQERTAQLEFANKELESFSYSVSHDLRAPLRHINGFSEMVIQDDTTQLSDRSRRHLQTVCDAARKMGELIEDLLNLARVSRTSMRMSPVALSMLAAEVMGELRRAEPGRAVEVKIAPDLQVEGDHHLLRIALVNLLGNAWKYTRKKDVASIEFGMTEQDGERVYFVRDNGAGFDMAYAQKLFGAFHRMHTQEDYEGHGIGLATVRRIINRHSGRIWADAAVNKGATFYFTLPGRL